MGKAKSIISILVLCMFVVVIAGCGSEQATTGDTVQVDIFQFKVEFKDAFEKLAKEYMASHKGVKINIETVGGGSDYGAALKAKFASGAEPTIFNIGGPQDMKDWQSKLANLSDTKAAKDAVDGVLKAVSKDGKVYGLPFNIEGYGLIYNKEIFEKAGIDPKSITSYAKLEEAVKVLDSKKQELGIVAVFAYPVKETWVTGLHTTNPFISAEMNEDMMQVFNAKTVEFKYGNSLKKIVDLQNNYSKQPTASLDYSQQVEELFSTGKVAIIQQGNWAYKSIHDIDAKFAENNIGILPLPVEGYKEDCIPVGVPMYWAVNASKDAKVVDAAKDFINWMYTSEEGKKIVQEDCNFIPAYKGYDVSKLSDPLSKEIANYIQNKKTINWVFMGYPSGWGMNKIGANIQEYTSGNMSWDNLIKSAQNEWQEARK